MRIIIIIFLALNLTGHLTFGADSSGLSVAQIHKDISLDLYRGDGGGVLGKMDAAIQNDENAANAITDPSSSDSLITVAKRIVDDYSTLYGIVCSTSKDKSAKAAADSDLNSALNDIKNSNDLEKAENFIQSMNGGERLKTITENASADLNELNKEKDRLLDDKLSLKQADEKIRTAKQIWETESGKLTDYKRQINDNKWETENSTLHISNLDSSIGALNAHIEKMKQWQKCYENAAGDASQLNSDLIDNIKGVQGFARGWIANNKDFISVVNTLKGIELKASDAAISVQTAKDNRLCDLSLHPAPDGLSNSYKYVEDQQYDGARNYSGDNNMGKRLKYFAALQYDQIGEDNVKSLKSQEEVLKDEMSCKPNKQG